MIERTNDRATFDLVMRSLDLEVGLRGFRCRQLICAMLFGVSKHHNPTSKAFCGCLSLQSTASTAISTALLHFLRQCFSTYCLRRLVQFIDLGALGMLLTNIETIVSMFEKSTFFHSRQKRRLRSCERKHNCDVLQSILCRKNSSRSFI